jgi:metallo-beta-lactamase class B
MLKRMAVGTAVAALAAMAFQVQVGAQQQGQQGGAPARRAVGGTTAGNDAYPTDDQWKNSKEAQALVSKAKAAAGNDAKLQSRFEKACTVLGPQRPAVLRQNAGLPAEPQRQVDIVKLFDNFYFFGFNTVGAWAVTTNQGIILIDSLNTVDEAEKIIEPALVKAGLKPADVKYIIVGHGHFDHFGGAPYFQQKYGSKVVMSKLDWDMIERPNPNARGPQANRPLPKRDVEVVSDNQKVTLGDETITLRITPGHTPGTLAYYIPVKDHGKQIEILMLSGANITPDRASLDAFKKALDYAKQQKVQALINGHPGLFGDEIGWMEQVRSNPNGPNPFVLTVDEFAKFADIMKDCAEARLVAMDTKKTATN